MRYQIKSQEGFEGIPVAEISNFPWEKEGDYRPQAGAQVSFGEDGLHVKLQALEDELYATTTEQLHFVHIDSCLEFFMRPFPKEDARYFNFEFNPLGITYSSLGDGRQNRVLLTMEDVLAMGISSRITWGKKAMWELTFRIPNQLIAKYFEGRVLQKGSVLEGNFYKCGEWTPTSHFGCWNPIRLPEPDFHAPQFFGELEIC